MFDEDILSDGHMAVIKIGDGPIEIEIKADLKDGTSRYLYFDYQSVIDCYENFVREKSEELELESFE